MQERFGDPMPRSLRRWTNRNGVALSKALALAPVDRHDGDLTPKCLILSMVSSDGSEYHVNMDDIAYTTSRSLRLRDDASDGGFQKLISKLKEDCTDELLLLLVKLTVENHFLLYTVPFNGKGVTGTLEDVQSVLQGLPTMKL